MEGMTEAIARRKPSFFKVLLNYTERLRLPPAFEKNYGECLSESVKLRSGSGEAWDVKMLTEYCVDEKGEAVRMKCFAGVGWRKFLNDWELNLGEFLVFCYNGESTFEVTVLGTNCCERLLSAVADDSDHDFKGKSPASLKGRGRPPKKLKDVKFSNGDEEEDDPQYKDHSHYVPVVVYMRRSPLSFEIVLKPHHLYRFSFRKKFYKAARLKGAETVVVEYAGRLHHIELDQRYDRVTMNGGWREFVLANRLEFEKKYSFEFKLKENVIHVKEVGNTRK